jgi:hypothetical protein
MPKRKSKKQIITEAILLEIKKSNSQYYDLDYDNVMFKWWFTGRQEGLRLTDEGLSAFELADIEYYDCEFKQDGQSFHNFVLNLNKKIHCPYYIGVNKNEKEKRFFIRLFDSKIAMMLTLYGNIQEYLNSVKERR